MMLYIPQEVRNQIAATGLMQQPKLMKIFQMKDLEKADNQLRRMARAQVESSTNLILPWIAVAPLLLENEAVSQYRSKNPDWSQALPEILTTQEATALAQADFLLSTKDQERLMAILQKPIR